MSPFQGMDFCSVSAWMDFGAVMDTTWLAAAKRSSDSLCHWALHKHSELVACDEFRNTCDRKYLMKTISTSIRTIFSSSTLVILPSTGVGRCQEIDKKYTSITKRTWTVFCTLRLLPPLPKNHIHKNPIFGPRKGSPKLTIIDVILTFNCTNIFITQAQSLSKMLRVSPTQFCKKVFSWIKRTVTSFWELLLFQFLAQRKC